MKIRELIEHLKEYDQELDVALDDWNEGYMTPWSDIDFRIMENELYYKGDTGAREKHLLLGVNFNKGETNGT